MRLAVNRSGIIGALAELGASDSERFSSWSRPATRPSANAADPPTLWYRRPSMDVATRRHSQELVHADV